MILEAYLDRKKRDARAKELRAEGLRVRVSVSYNSQLHPMYINDYVVTLETGFGNTQYQMIWPRLYHLEARLEPQSGEVFFTRTVGFNTEIVEGPSRRGR